MVVVDQAFFSHNDFGKHCQRKEGGCGCHEQSNKYPKGEVQVNGHQDTQYKSQDITCIAAYSIGRIFMPENRKLKMIQIIQ